jgi:hypothetical protein
MKKILILLAVATLPLTSGCCCARLCPCCPCNWFNRPATCPPTYAAPLVSSPCGPTYVPSPCAPSPCATCGPMASPLAATVMPQYMAPPAAPMMTQAQPMYYQQAPASACCGAAPSCCPSEPSCGCAAEPGCGGPYMGAVSYGPMMDCGPCSSCDPCGGGCGGGGCSSCDGGGAPPAAVVPTPQKFVDPAPATE